MRYGLLTSALVAAAFSGCATPAPQLPNHVPSAVASYGVIIDVQSSREPDAKGDYGSRYTVRLADGEIRYFDQIQKTEFHHSIGVCVSVPSLEQIAQKTCR